MRKLVIIFILIVAGNAKASDDVSRYAAPDRQALNVPVSVTNSVSALAIYLTKPFTREEDKARALFRWIAENISYDVEGYYSGTMTSSESADVLKSRTSVCEGYSSLFEAMGRRAGLEIVTIDGFAKGIGYHPGDDIPSKPNHAWNAVKIHGEWKLIDCTWGAGTVDAHRLYKKEFESYYFFTKPEEFVYRHFPTNKRWQLLQKPISRSEFQKLPFVSPPYFQCKLRMEGEQHSVLDLQDEMKLDIETPQDVYCNASFEQNGKILNNAVLLQRSGSTFHIQIIPPDAGEYYLNIYAKQGSSDGLFPHAIGFKIIAHSSPKKNSSFPLTYGTFVEQNVQLHSPLSRDLPSGSVQEFILTAPGAEKVAVVCGDEWDFLKKVGSQFKGVVEIDNGKVMVFAQYPEKNDFQALLEYTGIGSNKRAPAPVKFEKYINSGAELICPVKKVLPVGTIQNFRIKLPGAKKAVVVIGDEWHFLTKNGDLFECEVKILPQKITLLASYGNSNKFDGLLEYEGK